MIKITPSGVFVFGKNGGDSSPTDDYTYPIVTVKSIYLLENFLKIIACESVGIADYSLLL